MLKCFFFDRDGVIIKDYGYVYKIEILKWLKGSVRAIQFLNKKKIKVILITNQSGMARGYFSEKDVKKFHNEMNDILNKQKIHIDDFFFCPYHPNAKIKKYKRKSNLRKPGNGMLIKAKKKYNFKSNECFMIGDQIKDLQAAKKTQIPFEYKKGTSLENQVKNIVGRKNGT